MLQVNTEHLNNDTKLRTSLLQASTEHLNDDTKSFFAASERRRGEELELVLVDVGPLRPVFLEGFSQEARRWRRERGVNLGGGRRR